MAKYKYDKKHPPIYGALGPKAFEYKVNHKDFPKCSCCGNRIYSPLFYDTEYCEHVDMCGPCTTGEADTIMVHKDELDFSKYFQD